MNKYSAYQKAYRQRNKERYAEHSRNWRKNNPERSKEIDAKKYENGKDRNRRQKMLSAARDRAREKHLAFDLTLDDIIIPARCPVLGIELRPGNNNTRPELDRIKPEAGYVKGNVCVISGRANRIKWNASFDELYRVAEYSRRGL